MTPWEAEQLTWVEDEIAFLRDFISDIDASIHFTWELHDGARVDTTTATRARYAKQLETLEHHAEVLRDRLANLDEG